MGQDDGAARDRVITVATRRALLEDLRRARAHGALGVLLVVLGGGVALGVNALLLGPLGLLLCGGVGLTLILFGLGLTARAAYRMAAAWRRIQELDERTGLPVARVRSG